MIKGNSRKGNRKMKSKYIRENGSLVVYVPQELDHHQANMLRAETDMLIDLYHVRHLIFDFSETNFMDSSGIGVIIGRCRNLGYSGGDVSACNLNDRVDKIFSASGLKKMIHVVNS